MTEAPTPRARRKVAEAIRARRGALAEEATAAVLVRHPDFLVRYGERAAQRGVEDALFHSDFLAAAVELGTPDAFAAYARWTAGVLAARGIASELLAENLADLEAALALDVDADSALVRACVAAGKQACREATGHGAGAPEGGVASGVVGGSASTGRGGRRPASLGNTTMRMA